MPLNDWQDVLDRRRAADQAAERAHTRPLEEDENPAFAAAGALVLALDAFRLELRVLGVTISHALGEAVDARR